MGGSGRRGRLTDRGWTLCFTVVGSFMGRWSEHVSVFDFDTAEVFCGECSIVAASVIS